MGVWGKGDFFKSPFPYETHLILTSKFFRVVAPEKYRQYLRLELMNIPPHIKIA